MGLGTPKLPVQWVLGSSEENSDKNNFVQIKNTFDKKLFFFHGKDEKENNNNNFVSLNNNFNEELNKKETNNQTNSSLLFKQNSILEQNQENNNNENEQKILKEEQKLFNKNIEDLPKKRKKSFKICKCFPTVVRVIVESGAEEEEEIDEKRIITSSSTSQLPSSNDNTFTENSLSIMASFGMNSRFRIIPVNNNHYKRGRWQAWDYYNEGIDNKKVVIQPNILQQKEKIEEKLLKTENDIPLNSFNEKEQITNLSSTLSPLPQKSIPRRNSFQLVTIKSLEDKNTLNSVPTSISEEHLNLIGVNDIKENNLIKNWIKQQNSSEFITFPHSNRNKTPKIVEPKINELSSLKPSLKQSLNSDHPISIESTAISSSSRSLSPIKSITPPLIPSPQQMIIQPIINLERSLSFGLNGQNNEIIENNKINNLIYSSQQQQYFSASFGPGQIQFGGGGGGGMCIINGVGQNSQEERRRSIARRGSSASTGAVPSTAQQQKVDAGVNIDYKIEQAMDLVKTHLIYAVRDEIELLRSRIVELESTVFHLESENATLREHIPKEVLADISFDNIQQQQQFNNKQKVLFSINNISTNK
ncbi:hypothetical protein ACQ4LE_005585 [Meloidogyne hapla]